MSVIIKSGASGNTADVDASGNLQVVLATNPTITIGKVVIDQTTPGTTNGVQVNAPIPAGTNNIGEVTDQVATDAVPTLQTLRTPNIFRTAKATATGTQAIWTPATGKKFRLMRFKIQITADSAQTTGADVDFDLQDGATSLNLTHTVFIPTAAATVLAGYYESGWIDIGNGYLSTAANNVLNLVFTAVGFAGTVRVITAGNEE
jgi:hypothetical protein